MQSNFKRITLCLVLLTGCFSGELSHLAVLPNHCRSEPITNLCLPHLTRELSDQLMKSFSLTQVRFIFLFLFSPALIYLLTSLSPHLTCSPPPLLPPPTSHLPPPTSHLPPPTSLLPPPTSHLPPPTSLLLCSLLPPPSSHLPPPTSHLPAPPSVFVSTDTDRPPCRLLFLITVCFQFLVFPSFSL